MATHISWMEFWQGNYCGLHWKYIIAQLDPTIETASPEVKAEILKFAPEQVRKHYYKMLPDPSSIRIPKKVRQYIRR
jgi:hypothetical protein